MSSVRERSSSCDWLSSHLPLMSQWFTSHMASVLKETSTHVLYPEIQFKCNTWVGIWGSVGLMRTSNKEEDVKL